MTAPAHGLRALLLDLDNTLIDRDAAFERWMGARFPAAELPALRALDGRGQMPRSEFCGAVAAGWPVGGAAAFWEAFRVGIAEAVAPAPEVDAALVMLRERYALAVVSNGGSDNQRRKMAQAGLVFEAVFISGEVGFEKPDPRIFQAAMRELGVSAGEAMMVGDDWERDVVGAIGVGLRTCWVKPRGVAIHSPEPDLIIAHISELPDRLRRSM